MLPSQEVAQVDVDHAETSLSESGSHLVLSEWRQYAVFFECQMQMSAFLCLTLSLPLAPQHCNTLA